MGYFNLLVLAVSSLVWVVSSLVLVVSYLLLWFDNFDWAERRMKKGIIKRDGTEHRKL